MTTDMMSDEERVGDVYVRHPPYYRSGKFHKFLMKLDERAAAKGSHHLRFKRRGDVVEKIAPLNCKPWMLKKDIVTDERSNTIEGMSSESETLITSAPTCSDVND